LPYIASVFAIKISVFTVKMHKFRRVSRKFCGLAAAAASQFMQDAQSHGKDGKQDAQTEEAHRVSEVDVCIQQQADEPA